MEAIELARMDAAHATFGEDPLETTKKRFRDGEFDHIPTVKSALRARQDAQGLVLALEAVELARHTDQDGDWRSATILTTAALTQYKEQTNAD